MNALIRVMHSFFEEMSKPYKGKPYYKDDVVVAAGNLITASSAGGLLWARYILEHSNLYSSETIEAWYTTSRPVMQDISEN